MCFLFPLPISVLRLCCRTILSREPDWCCMWLRRSSRGFIRTSRWFLPSFQMLSGGGFPALAVKIWKPISSWSADLSKLSHKEHKKASKTEFSGCCPSAVFYSGLSLLKCSRFSCKLHLAQQVSLKNIWKATLNKSTNLSEFSKKSGSPVAGFFVAQGVFGLFVMCVMRRFTVCRFIYHLSQIGSTRGISWPLRSI